MRQLLIKQHDEQGFQHVYDTDFVVHYWIGGQTGKKGDLLTVYDNSGTTLVTIEQVSFGLLPQFQIRYKGNTVGSFGVRATFGELIFVTRLNWLITGTIINHRYRILHNTTTLLTVEPLQLPNGNFNQLTIYFDQQTPVHIALVALLNRLRGKTLYDRVHKLLPNHDKGFKLTFNTIKD